MGCQPSSPEIEEEEIRTKIINKSLKTEEKYQSSVQKLLLLGTGESGKTTIFKQIRYLHGKWFTKQQFKEFYPYIILFVIKSMKILVYYCESLDDPNFRISSASQGSLYYLRELHFNDPHSIPYNLGYHIKTLWNDKGIRALWRKRTLIQIDNSAQYFFEKIEQLCRPNYIPDKQDVLMLRMRTCGITEMQFSIEGIPFLMIDVGGQRNERRKWLHCFSEVTAILFVTAVNEYDMVLVEDEHVNRMFESMMLWREICNCSYFTKTSLILFLNKSDLLREKIKEVNLTVCFPKFRGSQTYEEAIKYIKAQYLSLNQDPTKEIYVHVTNATETQNIKVVFTAVNDSLIHKHLDKMQIMT